MFGGGGTGGNIFGGGGGGTTGGGAGNIFGGAGRGTADGKAGGTTGGTTGGGNIFGGGGGGQTGGAGIFGGGGGQTGQGQAGGIFGGGGGGQTGGGIFGGGGQGQTQGNIFGGGGQGQGQQTNIFGGGQGQTQGNIFGGGGQGQSQPLFGGSGGQNPIFGQQQQQGMMSLGAMGANLIQFAPDQQQQILKHLTPEYIRQLILNCRKQLDSKRLDYIQLSQDNPLKGDKISKVAATYNIKKPLLHVEKQTKEHLTTPLKELKECNAKLEKTSAELGERVFEKLQKYKERLVVAVGQGKLVEEVRKEVEEIDEQVKNFLKPLFNAHLKRNSYSFADPDPFCIAIAERLLRNISSLDNKMDELLACHSEPSQEVLDTAQVIQQLVEYYHNVAITLREFSSKYAQVKRRVVEKNRLGSPQEALRRLHEKAGAAVSKEMEAYELVKEIEGLLQKRERRMNESMRA